MACLYLYIIGVIDAMGKSISRLGSSLCGVGVIHINDKRYIIHKQLGEGAFSYVDLIEDLVDGTYYALKRIICHDSKVPFSNTK